MEKGNENQVSAQSKRDVYDKPTNDLTAEYLAETPDK